MMDFDLPDSVQFLKEAHEKNEQEKKELKEEILALQKYVHEELLELRGHKNGVLVWKILDVKKKRMEERSGKIRCVFSDNFHLGEFGHKLRAQMFLHGTGSGKGSHLSIYLQFSKGDYDAILPSVYRYAVSFELLDQSEGAEKKPIVWSWEPAFTTTDNDRQFKGGNCGTAELASHAVLERNDTYLKADSLYIKVIVVPLSVVTRSYVSNNGVLVWRISNYPQKKQDEKDGLMTWLESESFYSSARGYRMKAYLKLNAGGGTSDCDETSMSVHLAFLKGEHDDELPDQFPRQVTFMILDQSEPEQDESAISKVEMVNGDMAGMSDMADFTVLHSQVERPPYLIDNQIMVKIVVEPLEKKSKYGY